MQFQLYKIGYEIKSTNSDWKAVLLGLNNKDVDETLAKYINNRLDSTINISSREYVTHVDLLSDGIIELVNEKYYNEEVVPILEENNELKKKIKQLEKEAAKKSPKKSMKAKK